METGQTQCPTRPADRSIARTELSDDRELQLLQSLPPDFIESQLTEAENDAQRVAVYIEALIEGLRSVYPDQFSTTNWRTMFSAKVLLELAAALRVLEWERLGLVRDEMLLPRGELAVRRVLLNATNYDSQPNLSQHLVKVFAERFAWTASRKLGAAVVVDNLSVDDDQLADYLAHFLIESLQQRKGSNGE